MENKLGLFFILFGVFLGALSFFFVFAQMFFFYVLGFVLAGLFLSIGIFSNFIKSKKVYKIFGWIFILLGLIFGFFYCSLCSFNILHILSSFLMGDAFLLFLFISLFSLFLGIFYLRAGLNKIEENSLIRSSFFFSLSGIALFVLTLIYTFICFFSNEGEGMCLIFTIIGGIPSVIFLGISFLLVVINWIMNLLRKSE